MILCVKKNIKYLFLIALFGAAGLVWCAVFAESRNGLMVAFLDVGQGDAIFIQAENGNQVLLDGGPNKTVLSQLAKIMPFYDRSIDLLILSHPHADHLAGLIEVLKRYDVGGIIESGNENNTPEYREWENLIETKKIPRVLGKRGTRINLDENLFLNILLPARIATQSVAGGPVGDVKNSDVHGAMLVSKLNYAKTSYLFAGDMAKPLENYLVSLEGSRLKSDVLKVGHHGSNKSTSESLLGFVSPQYAVISVGKNNSYGHPHKETLEILNRFGIKIFRTDENGMIETKSDGENLTVVK